MLVLMSVSGLLLGLTSVAAHANALSHGAGVFNVLAYGARGDGVTDDTLALRATARAVAAAGSGTLLLPAAHTFLSQAFNLTSHTALVVEGTLLASNHTTLWPLIPPLPWYGGGSDAPMSGALEWQPFLLAVNADNISISGGGVIDGNGAAWWGCHTAMAPLPCGGFSRPHLIRPTHVRGFALHDVSILNPPAWTVHLANVSGALLERFSVRAPADVGNTDGVDVDCSRDVTVRDFLYEGGDDAIAVKSGLDWLGRVYGTATEDVLVERLTIRSGNGFAVGSEMSAGVRNVTFRNVDVACSVTPCKHGLYIKTVRGRGGIVDGVSVVNATISGVGFGHGVTLEYTRGVPPTNASATPIVRNVTVSGGSVVSSERAFDLQGLPDSVVTGVLLRDVAIGRGTHPTGACANVTGVCEGMAAADCPPCLKVEVEVGGTVTTCVADTDCSLTGVCSNGECVCDPGWKGAACGQLDIMPIDPHAGMNDMPLSSSWGGSVVLAPEDGLFHLFFSEILNGCPMSAWQTNSACFHATGTRPDGPFTNKSQVYGAFCHNTIIRRAWDEHGPLYMLWHIGDGNEADKVQKCAAGPPQRLSVSPPPPNGNTFSTARSVWGPWTRFPSNVLPTGDGAWAKSVSNMAPWPLPDGRVLLAFRGKDAAHMERLGMAMASNWSGPYVPLSTQPILNVTGEDPALFIDSRGNAHILFHEFATMGGHAFARDVAGPWTLGEPPYNDTVTWLNGSSTLLGNRERPELYFDPVTGAPRVLYNGACAPYNGSQWGPSFTMAAVVRG